MRTYSAVPAFLSAVLLAMSGAALAQDEMPAASGTAKIPAPARPAADKDVPGTDIVTGGEDAPFGLDIYPWREAIPERDIDRPARLLQEEMLPIDRTVFERQLEYYDALSGALKSKGLVTPQDRK